MASLRKEVQTKVYMKARDRANLSVNYSKPLTHREEWFRYNMDVTPGPNYYFDDNATKNDFVSKMLARKASYLLKSEGRARPVVEQDGRWLMPGEYNLGGIIQDLEKSRATYGFKNTGREAPIFNAVQPDKAMTVGPQEYFLEKLGSFYVPIKPIGIAPDCVDGGMGLTQRRCRRRLENHGTTDLWPPNGIRVAAVGLDVVNENNVLSGMLPVRPRGIGSQTSTALDVSLLLLLVSVGVAEPRSTA